MSFTIVSKLTFKYRVCYRVFYHGIAKGGDCKVVIYNYILCWLYSMTKNVVIVLILFLVFCGILLYCFNLRKSHVRSTCLKAEESCQAVVFANVLSVTPSREIVTKLFAWRFFKCDLLTLHPCYIYPHYPQM